MTKVIEAGWFMIGEIIFSKEEDGSLDIHLIGSKLNLREDRKTLFAQEVCAEKTHKIRDEQFENVLVMIHGRKGFHGGYLNLEWIGPSTKVIFCTRCGFRISIPSNVATLQEFVHHFESLGATFREIR